MYYPNGDFFDGLLNKGIKHGFGRYIWENGDIYEGNWI